MADYPLGDVKPFAVEEWLPGLTLEPKSRNHIKTILINVFNCAMRWDRLPANLQNPMRLVRVPGCSKRRKKPRVLTTDEFWRLIEKLEHEPARTTAIVAICLGLRISKLAALQ